LTQQQLNRIAATLRPVDPQSIKQLNLALRGFSRRPEPAGRSLLSSDPLASARALSRLATSLSALSPSQRSRLVHALGQAANRIRDQRLRSTLRQAASSLANSDPQVSSRALQRAATFLSNSPARRTARSRVRQASDQLQQLKNSIAGLQRRTAGGPPSGQNGATGRRSGSGKGSRSASGRPPDTGQVAGRTSGVSGPLVPRRNNGPQPEVVDAGGKSSAGRISGVTKRKGGQGGFVTDPVTGSQTNTNHAKYVTVYVPGVRGHGAHTFQAGPSSQVRPGALIPYRQVFVQYEQTAHAALERSTLPPDLQSYVRQYFWALSQ
jgi:hypothetical protein